MANSRVSILSSLIALLWMVGINHCAFEDVFAASNQLQDSNECPAHSNDDSDSHNEGQPCGIKVLSSETQRLIQPAFSEPSLLPALISYVLNSLLLSQESIQIDLNSGVEPIPLRLISLSIASNAPPLFV